MQFEKLPPQVRQVQFDGDREVLKKMGRKGARQRELNRQKRLEEEERASFKTRAPKLEKECKEMDHEANRDISPVDKEGEE